MAFLTFVARDHQASYQLTEEVVLGRSYDCDIFVPDVFVSRQHCRFEKTAQGWMVVDLGSKNGIFFKGTRIKRRELHHDDVVELGSVAFIFDTGDLETLELSTSMPYGKGSRVTEMIDTLFAADTRPADYVRRKGRTPKTKVAAEPELPDDESIVIPEREENEWTELDVEVQVALLEAPAPRFNFLEEMPNPAVADFATAGNGARARGNAAPGTFRAVRDLQALEMGAAAESNGGGSATAVAEAPNGKGFGGQSYWSTPQGQSEPSKDAKKERKVRKPKREADPDRPPLQQRAYDAFQDVLFRIRENPLISSGVAATIVVLMITMMYFSNRRHIPEYDLDKMTEHDKFNLLNASAN